MNFHSNQSFQPIISISVLIAWQKAQNSLKTQQAGFMEGYFRLAAQFRTQEEPLFCGITTMTMVRIEDNESHIYIFNANC